MKAETEVTSRWRWVVLVSSFFSLLITGYAQYHAGVIKVALLRYRDYDVSTTTWLTAFYAGSFALTALVGSAVVNVTTCRTCGVLSGFVCLLGFVLSSVVTDVTSLFLAFTLVGIGQGMNNTSAFVVLGYYFPKQASIALGVSISGGALGIFVHPPLLQTLVDWYGLQGALLLSGAIAFHASALGAVMRPNSLERKATQGKPGNNTLQKLCALGAGITRLHRSPLASRAMAVFLLSIFIKSMAFHSLLVLLPYHLIHVGGLTPTEASFAISVSGTGSFFSRLTSGFLAHDPRVGNVLVFSGMIGVQALVSLTAPSLIAQGIGGSYAYSFMVGLYTGGVFTLYYPILLEIVGLHHAATALGLAFLSLGLGGLIGAPLTELVQVTSSHPYAMFGFLGALFFLSAILSSLVPSLIPSKESTPAHHQTCSASVSLSDRKSNHPLDDEEAHFTESTPNGAQNQTDAQLRLLLNKETEVFQPTAKFTIVNASEAVRKRDVPEVTKPLLHVAAAELRTSDVVSHVSHEVQEEMPELER